MSLASAWREWREYRRFTRLPQEARRIVIYSESGQDWHHFAPVITHLAGPLGRSVCYVSSDAGDPGLMTGNERIRGFCVGRGLFRIWFFQFLRADVMAMTMIDLGNFDLKRSINPVHYVFMFHSLISTHMADHPDSYDHYDSILCAGPHQMREIRRREELHGLPAKQLFPHGYHRLEYLMANRREPPPVGANGEIHVLIAPSWGEQTILNLMGVEIIGILLDAGFRVTLRPHYQTRWMTPAVIDRITVCYGGHPLFRLVEQMGESDSLFDSHVMITDWSGAGQDYGMGLEKPVLYIDVPPKARNTVWPELGMEPFESFVRARLGAILAPDAIAEAPRVIRELVADPAAFRRNIAALRADWVFNPGRSGPAGAEALAAIADQVAQSGRTPRDTVRSG